MRRISILRCIIAFAAVALDFQVIAQTLSTSCPALAGLVARGLDAIVPLIWVPNSKPITLRWYDHNRPALMWFPSGHCQWGPSFGILINPLQHLYEHLQIRGPMVPKKVRAHPTGPYETPVIHIYIYIVYDTRYVLCSVWCMVYTHANPTKTNGFWTPLVFSLCDPQESQLWAPLGTSTWGPGSSKTRAIPETMGFGRILMFSGLLLRKSM